ncbi:MAG: glycosyl transferase family 1, partial [Armatimonadota bacterium]
IAAALDAGFPTTVTMHDYGLACPIAILYDDPSQAICHRTPLSLDCWRAPCMGPDAYRLKLLRTLRVLGQRTVLRVDRRLRTVIAVSKFCARIMRPFLPGKPSIVVLPNPVDAIRGPAARPADARAVLWAGNMTPIKDSILAARAAARADMPITFAGDGPLREETARANPEATMLGWLDAEGTDAAMRAARAFVLTSRWYETASLVTLEAMARGIPPIVPDQCAATEWFEDGLEGLVYNTSDEDSLVRALEQIQDPVRVAELGQNAHERYWSDPLTMSRHLDGLEQLYGELLAS